jgi:NitT/TauT family transport system substrate-binding protein
MPCRFAMWVFIESSPRKIIAHGTDWRFLNELKRELKA